MGVPPLRVGERQPTDELRQLAILPRPDDEVPVIRHETVREQPSPGPLDRFGEDVLERFVIPILFKDGHPRVGAVQHVINVPTLSGSTRASHAPKLPNSHTPVKKTVPDTFSGQFEMAMFFQKIE
jgi:hypothetical protein